MYIYYTLYSTIIKYSTILWDSKKIFIMTTAIKKQQHDAKQCTGMLLPVRDALDFLNGKWKIPIIISLSFGNKRFKEMATEIQGITDKMLSKELRDLEQNQLVKRTVYATVPVKVEYSLTDYGSSLDKVIAELRAWGVQHRKRIMKK